jgi:hypothetical protein
MGVTNQVVSGMVLNSQPQRVPVPYTKTSLTPVEFLSTTGHANPVGSRGRNDLLIQLRQGACTGLRRHDGIAVT